MRADPPVLLGEAIIGDLLCTNRLLIPIAVEANGRLGPMIQYTLFGTIPPPIPPPLSLIDPMPRQCTNEQHLSQLPVE